MPKLHFLSDLHRGKGQTHDLELLDRYEIYMREMVDPVNDTVVLGGDLVDDPSLEAFLAFRQKFLEPYPEYRIFVVPGNHDYARWGWWWQRRRKAFEGVFKKVFAAYIPVEYNRGVVEVAPGVRLMLLDTMAGAGKLMFPLAQGRMGGAALQGIEAQLAWCKEQGYRLILAGHHHLFSHRGSLELDDSEALQEVLNHYAPQVHTYLMGHEHKPGTWARLYRIRASGMFVRDGAVVVDL